MNLLRDPKEYPCFNRSLENLPGEEWKEIEGMDGYYLISNYGRVKSLPRLVEVFLPKRQLYVNRWTHEKILAIKVHEKWNSFVQESSYECTVNITFQGKAKTFMVHRLVYHAFVAPLDFEFDKVMIIHRDGDGLNNQAQNLEAGFRSDVTARAYRNNRHYSPFALKGRQEMEAIRQKGVLSRQKPVVQCAMSGAVIKEFASIKEAAQYNGIPEPNIISALKGRVKTAGGYRWQYSSQGR